MLSENFISSNSRQFSIVSDCIYSRKHFSSTNSLILYEIKLSVQLSFERIFFYQHVNKIPINTHITNITTGTRNFVLTSFEMFSERTLKYSLRDLL